MSPIGLVSSGDLSHSQHDFVFFTLVRADRARWAHVPFEWESGTFKRNVKRPRETPPASEKVFHE
jgi:hypothetical protein